MGDMLAEAVAVVANMVEAALAAGGCSDDRWACERKMTGAHLQRLAVIYVRQSTLAQVRFHRESTERQYALADEAARLGWEATGSWSLDSDLGLSGATRKSAKGSRSWSAGCACGEVGAIFGLEVSRLARSSADLQRLLGVVRVDRHPDRRRGWDL